MVFERLCACAHQRMCVVKHAAPTCTLHRSLHHWLVARTACCVLRDSRCGLLFVGGGSQRDGDARGTYECARTYALEYSTKKTTAWQTHDALRAATAYTATATPQFTRFVRTANTCEGLGNNSACEYGYNCTDSCRDPTDRTNTTKLKRMLHVNSGAAKDGNERAKDGNERANSQKPTNGYMQANERAGGVGQRNSSARTKTAQAAAVRLSHVSQTNKRLGEPLPGPKVQKKET